MPQQRKAVEEVPQGPLPPPLMKKCHRLISPHFHLDQKILDFLDGENSDFLVVGIAGLKNVGKSTLMNIIASPNYLKVDDDTSSVTFQRKHEVFPVERVIYEGNTIDMFITMDRIIFLDTSPLLSNIQRRDMIVAEGDDIRMMMLMLQLCHLVLVVHEGFPSMQLTRIISVADQMVPTRMKHRPVFAYIGNKVQPGARIMEMDRRLHDGANLTVPNLRHPDISLHHDIHQIIQDVQEKVFMMKRWSMMDSDEEVFTEKKWGQRLVKVTEQLKNDFFLRKYEGLRDKFHQPIEN